MCRHYHHRHHRHHISTTTTIIIIMKNQNTGNTGGRSFINENVKGEVPGKLILFEGRSVIGMLFNQEFITVMRCLVFFVSPVANSSLNLSKRRHLSFTSTMISVRR